MSWQATAYVKDLKRCEDGADLGRGQKLLLFVLGDSHNPHERRAYPSIITMAQEALTSLAQVKRDLAYLEEHCVIRKVHPEKSGRGHHCSYVFLALDDPMELKRRLAERAKGAQGEPFFCAMETGSEGVQIDAERGSKGVHGAQAHKEEPKNPTTTQEQAQCANPSARAEALRAKRPQVVVQFEKELRLIYEAGVGAQAAWSSDRAVQMRRDVNAAMAAAERCRLPIELGLALVGFTDPQIHALSRRARSPDEERANMQEALALAGTQETAAVVEQGTGAA